MLQTRNFIIMHAEHMFVKFSLLFSLSFVLYLIPNSTNSNGDSAFPRTTSQTSAGEFYTRPYVSCEVASKNCGMQYKSQPLSLTDVSKYLCRFLMIAMCFNMLAYSIVIQSHGHQH